MTSTRRSLPKSFSSFLLTGAILTVALLAFVPVAFYAGRKGYPKSGQASEAKTLLNPEGECSSLRLQARGNTFSCWINGKKASEYTDATFSGAAPLGLQIHGDVVMKVEYRNLRIADLAAGEGKTH